jgi:hypothetical protein
LVLKRPVSFNPRTAQVAAATYLPNDRFDTQESVILITVRHLHFWAIRGAS